jgi:hypothetical protein
MSLCLSNLYLGDLCLVNMTDMAKLVHTLAFIRASSCAGMPPSELVRLLGQQPNGQQIAREKVVGLTRFLSEFIGVIQLELPHPQAPLVILQMNAS